MLQTDGTGRHNSVNLGLFSVKMPNLGAHFFPKENTYFFVEFFPYAQHMYCATQANILRLLLLYELCCFS